MRITLKNQLQIKKKIFLQFYNSPSTLGLSLLFACTTVILCKLLASTGIFIVLIRRNILQAPTVILREIMIRGTFLFKCRI